MGGQGEKNLGFYSSLQTTIYLLVLLYLQNIECVCPSGWNETLPDNCFKYISDTPKTWSEAKLFCETLGSSVTNTPGSLALPGTEPGNTNLAALMKKIYENSANDGERSINRNVWIGGKQEQLLNPFWRVIDDLGILGQSRSLRPVGEQGCYGDQVQNRDLQHQAVITGSSPMTQQICIDYCTKEGFKYAGLQRGSECHCGDTYGKFGTTTECVTPCVGDKTTYCGGDSKNTIFDLSANSAYVNWAYNQPNNLYKMQLCGAMEERNRWKMGDEECYKQHYHICRIDPALPCPTTNRYQSLNGKCLYYEVDRKMTWFQARAACLAIQGQLAVIDSESERVAVGNKIKSYGKREPQSGVFVWIGLVAKQWLWTNGFPLAYTGWDTEEPNDDLNNCIKYKYLDTAGVQAYKWFDADCDSKLPFICQLGGTYTQPNSGGTSSPTQIPVAGSTTGQANTNTDSSIGSRNTTASPGSTTTGSGDSTPDAGASTNASGLSVTEIVLLVILAVVIIVVIVLIISCCCYYKKNKESRAAVYPDKGLTDLRNQVMIPYGEYYGNIPASTYEDSFHDNSKSGGMVLNAGHLGQQEKDDAYMDYKPAATLAAMGSQVTHDNGSDLPPLGGEVKIKRKKRRSKRNENPYEQLDDNRRQLPKISLD